MGPNQDISGSVRESAIAAQNRPLADIVAGAVGVLIFVAGVAAAGAAAWVTFLLARAVWRWGRNWRDSRRPAQDWGDH